MKRSVRIALAQIDASVGDLDGNAERIVDAAAQAKAAGCDVVLAPELAITGYPPEDLILKPAFIKDNIAVLRKTAARLRGLRALVGFVDEERGRRFNAAAWIEDGRVRGVYRKRCLPNYGVFDEKRYFAEGTQPFIVSVNGLRLAVTICEDIWVAGPHLDQVRKSRPHAILNISASPYHAGKALDRRAVFRKTARYAGAPIFYCNLVGGQDELVFDGGSFVAQPGAAVPVQGPFFRAGVVVGDLTVSGRLSTVTGPSAPEAPLGRLEEIRRALVLGIRDYVEKNRFSTVAIGLSGGIDSTLVAALAVEALGKERVVGVTMPSRFNTAETRSDAKKLADNLGIRFYEIPIGSLFDAYMAALSPLFGDRPPNIAEENLQARIRGALLMALSNKFDWLILTTGNKSEISTGYCTLYGDTAGGFDVLKDVLKTTVFALCEHINAERPIIPPSVIERPPSAELRSEQRDEDSLGPYAELDPLIVGYIENNRSLAALAAERPGKAAYVERIINLIDRNEYKRRQAPPGIKISPRSFGRDHRMPITNRYSHRRA